uniref:Uncharacterized protein n=1 Tax=Globisporangium ultimum (strain ATCC 200006 / CBS 805.95 / DAOM BR144) TaxID=431595 RepID=K3W951_GLOUD
MLLLLCTCSSLLSSATLADGSQAGSSFVVVEDPITSTSTSRFDKVWHIKSGASGSPTAVANLVLDLPGQVFVSYAKSKSVASDVLGVITVSDSVSTTVEAVGVSIRSAMKGEKVMIHSKNATALSDDHASLLTTVQLLRKSALKKVITNGAATVVIADNVLFSKKKEDYKEQRDIRKLEDTNSSSLIVQEKMLRKDSKMRTWFIQEIQGDVTSIDLDLAIPGNAQVERIDSDLLPERAIGMIRAPWIKPKS